MSIQIIHYLNCEDVTLSVPGIKTLGQRLATTNPTETLDVTCTFKLDQMNDVFFKDAQGQSVKSVAFLKRISGYVDVSFDLTFVYGIGTTHTASLDSLLISESITCPGNPSVSDNLLLLVN